MTSKDYGWCELPLARIHQAIAGDRGAQQDLFDCYGPAVRSAVAARIRHQPDLQDTFEDVIGEVWLSVLEDPRHLRRYDPSKAKFGFFIRLVASNIAWRILAKERRRRNPPEPVGLDPQGEVLGEVFERQLFHRDVLERLWNGVQDRLTEVDLELFEAVLVKGQTVREVAARVGMTDRALYQRLSRMKERIAAISVELLDAPDPDPKHIHLVAFTLLGVLATIPSNEEEESGLSQEAGATISVQRRLHASGSITTVVQKPHLWTITPDAYYREV